ncbi:MAG: DinB family protein [Sphingobacteriales bacterium]|nr:DinB family protein [Sphingobacteriales bacterium]
MITITNTTGMQLQQAVQNVFVQLAETISQLSAHQYAQPCKTLNNATVGQHVRHAIELFQCLEQGYESGLVNYEKRKRDLLIETDNKLASSILNQLYKELNKENKALQLDSMYDDTSDEIVSVSTNYHREIIYNLEHTIHHMALIRIGVKEVSTIELPADFGVASSTMRYRKNVHSNIHTA